MVEVPIIDSELDWENNSQSSYEDFYRLNTCLKTPEITLDLLVEHIADFQEKLAEDHKEMYVQKSSFDSQRTPSIRLKDYLKRIKTYSIASTEAFILALIYIDRYTTSNDNLCVTPQNIHKLVITSIQSAAKFVDDFRYNNADMARIGGMSCQELNKLEQEFLTGIDFDLYVKLDEYQNIYHYIIDTIGEESKSTTAGSMIDIE